MIDLSWRLYTAAGAVLTVASLGSVRAVAVRASVTAARERMTAPVAAMRWVVDMATASCWLSIAAVRSVVVLTVRSGGREAVENRSRTGRCGG
jgi:hypothetical protein